MISIGCFEPNIGPAPIMFRSMNRVGKGIFRYCLIRLVLAMTGHAQEREEARAARSMHLSY